jgi:hypothetical protein
LPARATFDNADALASWLDQLLPQLHALREVLAGGDAAAVEAWHAGAADALEAWARAGSDLPPEAAAFDALDGQGGMREWLFGRLGRGPAGPGRK